MAENEFVKMHYADQIQALTWLIEERFHRLPLESQKLLRFGGGTALAMYYFQHRLSFDVDLFATDQQVLDFFRPKIWLDESRYFNTDEYIDEHNHVGFLSHNNIRVDILASSSYQDGYIDQTKNYFPINIVVESIEDIIAKKIVFRNKLNKTRDIIDIAIALEHDQELFSQLISKEFVNREHLSVLAHSIEGLEKSKFEMEIEIVAPFEKYIQIAQNAPEMVLDGIKKL